MKRMSFKRPTNYYDDKINLIDEKICELIKQRKETSNNNPGYPPFEFISNWAEKFDLYEDLLKSIFGSLWNDKTYRPLVEPEGFQSNLQVLKSIEVDNRFFSIIYIRQYSNCSVVNLNIDWDNLSDSSECQSRHTLFQLFISDQYDCRFSSGTGGDEFLHNKFIISPPLPDNISGIKLIFKEYNLPLTDTPIGHDIIIQL
ncbi:hypothetical protein LL033_25715 (plasmid) [Clostridium estertheticum]|uniref:hypothetical protein n=1 Tax=Clostridium estertheticum TaxID=238834 RepID=UPI001C0CC819|nr:hypothetical protein [Clostridium estertheticum]MBU3217381.1 hypothetical protein [Clostridium estertheticum]WAG58157.1 hypothetical protein LL033_25715 [Clostridium estertheticum]